jgi:ABC-type branched-subunit amino acid transport system permease subunit
VDRRRQYLTMLFLAVVLLALPWLIANTYYLHLIQMISLYTMVALGLNLLFGHTGQISLGHAGFYAIGAYTSAILETKLGLFFWVAWPTAVLLAVVVAVVIGYPILRLQGHYLAMATLAFGLIVGSIATEWISVTGGHGGIYLPIKRLLGTWLADNLYSLTVLLGIVTYLLISQLVSSRVGRALHAIRDDPAAAVALGIDVARYKIIAFAMSAALAAVGGILYAHITRDITPEVFNLNTSILFLLMVVIGGMRSNMGAFLGAAFITLLPEFLYGFAKYNILIYGFLVTAVLLFAPEGLIGLVQAGVRALTSWRATARIAHGEKEPKIRRGGI